MTTPLEPQPHAREPNDVHLSQTDLAPYSDFTITSVVHVLLILLDAMNGVLDPHHEEYPPEQRGTPADLVHALGRALITARDDRTTALTRLEEDL